MAFKIGLTMYCQLYEVSQSKKNYFNFALICKDVLFVRFQLKAVPKLDYSQNPIFKCHLLISMSKTLILGFYKIFANYLKIYSLLEKPKGKSE